MSRSVPGMYGVSRVVRAFASWWVTRAPLPTAGGAPTRPEPWHDPVTDRRSYPERVLVALRAPVVGRQEGEEDEADEYEAEEKEPSEDENEQGHLGHDAVPGQEIDGADGMTRPRIHAERVGSGATGCAFRASVRARCRPPCDERQRRRHPQPGANASQRYHQSVREGRVAV